MTISNAINLLKRIFGKLSKLYIYVARLRSRVATGQTHQPPASDMMELSWDPELASVAQAHADQCKFRRGIVLEEIIQIKVICDLVLIPTVTADTTALSAAAWSGSRWARTCTSPSTPARSAPTGGRRSTPGSRRSTSSRCPACPATGSTTRRGTTARWSGAPPPG